jgi:hypothetical protein
MKERLDILGNPGDENWESFLAQTRTVISTGIKSAAKTLHILTSGDSLLRKSHLHFRDLVLAAQRVDAQPHFYRIFPGL